MKLFNKSVFQKFILIAIPIMVLWCAMVVHNMAKDKQYTEERLISENQIQDQNTSVLIGKYMKEISENLKVIRDSSEMASFVNDENEQSYDEMVGMFMRVMSNKKDYDQLRYIDKEGNEIVRIEYTDQINMVPLENLQNQKNKEYFNNTIQLNAGEIYISPMVLNLENNQFETPYKPLILFSAPVYDKQNRLKGIIVINYKAQYFLDMLSAHNVHRGIETSNFYVINKEGKFILHMDQKKDFSFMFDETKELTLRDENEALWQIIQNGYQGNFELNSTLITYYDVLQDIKEINPNYDEKWILVHEMDTGKLFSINSILFRLFLTNNVIVIILIGIFAYIISIVFDKLKLKDTQLEITQKIAETTNDAILITDSETHITYVNQAYEESTGYSESELIGLKPSLFKSGKHDDQFYKNMWEKIKTEGYWEGMLWNKKKDGLLLPKKLRIIAVKEKNRENAHHYIGVYSDPTAAKRKTDAFESFTNMERNFMLPDEDMMFELLKQSVKNKNFSFMVLYITIENYNQLITTFRDMEVDSSDTFINLIKPLIHDNDFVAQTSRNLFAVIVDMQYVDNAPEDFVQQIHKQLTRVMTINEQNVFFKTRIGVSYWPRDANDLKKLILNSIIALEWTTRNRDSEVAFFSEDMIQQLNRENEIEGYLRKAIENKELFVVYQPQIDVKTEKIVGTEALLRWENKVLGSVSPVVFIPIAEKNHLMIDIGNWVIEKVCEDLQHITLKHDGLLDNIRCAINLSPIQIEESGFLDKLHHTIERFGINRCNLEMEITEGLLLSNEMKNIKLLENIRSQGIKIAIDDFGTGYSSLSYLNTLPVDKIKIDRSFIKNYPEMDDGKLVKFLVDMSRSLDKEVLIEGAETGEQVDYLKRIGCDYIQGYYYSKPLTRDVFIQFLINRK